VGELGRMLLFKEKTILRKSAKTICENLRENKRMWGCEGVGELGRGTHLKYYELLLKNPYISGKYISKSYAPVIIKKAA
jgi:hypothetical protein